MAFRIIDGGGPMFGNLDDRFGVALAPNRIDGCEIRYQPHSLQMLDRASASLLRALMTATEQGLGVTTYVYSELPILWVIDSAGFLWFAIEEIVNEGNGAFMAPRLGHARPAPPRCRLGHPALLSGQPGRIGGELFFDTGRSTPAWMITNGSGRYGLRPGRRADHLANVVALFLAFGITVMQDFIAPD